MDSKRVVVFLALSFIPFTSVKIIVLPASNNSGNTVFNNSGILSNILGKILTFLIII